MELKKYNNESKKKMVVKQHNIFSPEKITLNMLSYIKFLS